MSKESIIFKTAERLGIQDVAVLQKAEEFLRTFQWKGSIKTLNDVAKTVLCLDLSSNHLGRQFDKDSAIKLSGLKKSAYITNLHNIEKILELNKTMTVANLCVQLNCPDVKELAQSILSKYALRLDSQDVHPQYVAAAIYTACKARKIKCDLSEFIQVSRTKPSQWKNLISDFQAIANNLKIQKKQMISEEVDKLSQKTDNDPCEDNISTTIEAEESYDEWKDRILREAYAALNH